MTRRVASYFVVCGLPSQADQTQMDEYNLEVITLQTCRILNSILLMGTAHLSLNLVEEISNSVLIQVSLKPSHNQDPITDVTVIFPGLGENTPDSYQLIDFTPTKQPADLNHGSFRAPEVFICFRRGRDKPPLIDLGIVEPEKDRMTPGYQLVEFTPNGHIANVNNSANASSFITYRRATEMNPCNEFVVMDIAVIIASKGEVPPHTFMKVSCPLMSQLAPTMQT